MVSLYFKLKKFTCHIFSADIVDLSRSSCCGKLCSFNARWKPDRVSFLHLITLACCAVHSVLLRVWGSVSAFDRYKINEKPSCFEKSQQKLSISQKEMQSTTTWSSIKGIASSHGWTKRLINKLIVRIFMDRLGVDVISSMKKENRLIVIVNVPTASYVARLTCIIQFG